MLGRTREIRLKSSCLHTVLAAAILVWPLAARAQIAVLGNSVQEREAAPGQSYGGEILIMNSSDRAQTAKVYQTDYLFFADGTSRYDEPGATPRSNARWLSIGPTLVTVPPGGTVPVRYTVTVPAGEPLVGTYWSMIMVEGVPKESPESLMIAASSRDRSGLGVQPIIRYGVQVVSQIQHTGTRRAEFAATRLVSSPDGTKALEFDIRNTGERAYRLHVWVELYDERGTLHGRLEQARGLIYPGTSIKQRFDLSRMPPRAYKALIVADTGDEDVFGAQYRFTL
jgi:hypothetical protein